MKTLTKALGILLIAALTITSCKTTVSTGGAKSTTQKTKKVPPGQAKKKNGDKSAKKYAPGHN